MSLPVDKTGYVRAEIRKRAGILRPFIDKLVQRILYKNVKPTVPKYSICALSNPIYFE
jgi:hypothetical protein